MAAFATVYRMTPLSYREYYTEESKTEVARMEKCDYFEGERGRVCLDIVIAANARKDLISDAERRILGRHKRADLSHDLSQRNLTQVGRLATLRHAKNQAHN